MKEKLVIDGREFTKSSFSGVQHSCVGVSIGKNDVLVTNTNTRSQILRFTPTEWDAFLKGVKNDEFDL